MSDFYVVMSELIHDPKILQMKNYAQHNSSNTFKHSVHVALTAYRLSKIFHLKIDESSLAKGAMLHDFYLYDARGGQIGAWKHGTGHADTALNNSLKHYQLTRLEKEIIYCHMWPLNITRVPRSKESLLISMADKYCAAREMMARRKVISAA
ncbi:MAG: HD family phosphohydrolase [Lachnospiraceae bacterium]|nr:HD family phosphohydrolase [Lachnospiraceae bacterium]